MFAIIRTRWQPRPLSRPAKRRSSAAPGSPRKKYAGILHPPNMVRLLINSTTSGDHRKPVLVPYACHDAKPRHATPARIVGALKRLGFTPGSWRRLRETLRGTIGVVVS